MDIGKDELAIISQKDLVILWQIDHKLNFFVYCKAHSLLAFLRRLGGAGIRRQYVSFPSQNLNALVTNTNFFAGYNSACVALTFSAE